MVTCKINHHFKKFAEGGNGDDIVEDGIIILLYTPGCPIGAYYLT